MTSRELAVMMQKSPVDCHKALVKEYGRYVYAIAYNKLRGCGTNEDIEECVSDVFADLFMKCEYDLSYENDIKYLIATIAKRKAIDYFRSLSARGSHIAENDEDDMRELASDFSVDEHVERSELRRVLLDKIDETVALEKALESPLDCKEIQPVHSEGDQPWVIFGRNDAKAETPVVWSPYVKS